MPDMRDAFKRAGYKDGESRNKRQNLRRNEGRRRHERENRNREEQRLNTKFKWDEIESISEIESPVLLLKKMKPYFYDSYIPYERSKKKFLDDIKEILKNLNNPPAPVWKGFVERLKSEYISSGANCVEYRLSSKLIAGLGSGNTLENSISIHHIYGFPYVPSSSFKGVVRDVALREMFKDEENYEELDKKLSTMKYEDAKDEKKKLFLRIFGSQDRKGEVVFYDVLPDPENPPEFEIEIINNHYMSYYNELNSGDKNIVWEERYEREKPNPVFFLVVKGGKFLAFYKAPEDIKNIVEKFIETAFKEHGLGAKTRYGYGYFERFV